MLSPCRSRYRINSRSFSFAVSTEAMRGANAADAAAIQQWMSFGDSEVTPASCTWVYPCLGIMQFNKQNTERAKTELKQALAVLNEFLSTRTYLVGERISLADVCLCCNLLALYTMVSSMYVHNNNYLFVYKA